MRWRIIVLFLSGVFSFFFSVAQPKQPVPVIFDSDMGPDYDDVGAISLLHALADSGEARILATIGSNEYPGIAAVFNVFNTYFNRPGIPIAIPKTAVVKMRPPQGWDSVILARYPHNIPSNKNIVDAVTLYRKILAAQRDGSVTIVTVGFLTNLSQLLQSGPDQSSPLGGRDLVKKKVKQLVCMAGAFPSGKEFNVHMDAASSCNVFSTWPGEILFSGFEIGKMIFTGLPLVHNEAITNSPVKDVFSKSIPMDPADSIGRMSWDETAVLVAVRGWQQYYSVVRGRFICNADGSNAWNASGEGHAYLVPKADPAVVGVLINHLIMHQPHSKLKTSRR